MQFRVLGAVEVAGERGVRPVGGPKQRAVLAYLLLHARTLVTSERLIDAVWNGAPPRAVRTSLHSYVSNLRRMVGTDRLEGRDGGYVLHAEGDEIDAERFVALLDRAATMSPARPAARATLLRDALALWRGPALDGLGDLPAFQPDVVRLHERRAAANENLVAALLADGAYKDVIATTEALLTDDPLRERLWEQLISALYLDGRRADALAACGRTRAVLREQLGVDPSPPLQRLQSMMLAQDPMLETLRIPLRGYRLHERVRRGGTVTRYRADEPSTGRALLVDVFGPTLANDPDFVRRFRSDAQAIATLHHPHVVPLVDWWREPDAAYVVTPALDARPLAHLLAGDDGAPDGLDVPRIVGQLRDALTAMHGRGVGHGDVRPGTVLVDDDGDAHLTDIALGRASLREPATHDGDRAALAAIASALHHDAVPLGRARPDVRRRNPFKGLRVFHEADAPEFFGRRRAVGQLVGRLESDERFLAVVGPSGTGKSSLVHAGLVPALRAGAVPGSHRWLAVVMMPGAQPFDGLGAALLSVARTAETDLAAQLAARDTALGDAACRIVPVGAELLLVVDQFEEVFTHASPDDRDAFIAALSTAATTPKVPLRVVVTMRADFFDRALRYGTLATLLTSRTELVTPLTPSEVTQAITGPAEVAGITVESTLVAEIVRDIANEPGALPLLQYALTEVYERGGDALTVDDYQAVGGMAGALARRAEQTFADLPEPVARAARQLFLRAVTLGERTGDVRRRISRAELLDLATDPAAMRHALDAFGAARLLTFDRDVETREPTVEIAHEALLTQWSRLRTWVDTARAGLQTQRRLAASTSDWVTSGRDPSYLAAGHRLEQFVDLVTRSDIAIAPAEREYVGASRSEQQHRAAQDAARRTEEERLRRRSFRRLQAVLLVLAVGVVIAGVLLTFVLRQRDAARRQAHLAEALELAAAADAATEIDPQRGTLLAMGAVEGLRADDGDALRSRGAATARPWQAARPPGPGRSICGPARCWGSPARSPPTTVRSRASRSRPTAQAWPRRAATARCGSGTPGGASGSTRSAPGGAASCLRRSEPTGRGWSPRCRTPGSSSSPTWRAAGSWTRSRPTAPSTPQRSRRPVTSPMRCRTTPPSSSSTTGPGRPATGSAHPMDVRAGLPPRRQRPRLAGGRRR